MRIVHALALILAISLPASAKSPNVILIVADDLGYGDLTYTDGATKWKTPRLEELVRGGTSFLSFYAAQPVCSASRAAILTGCYPNRIGIAGALGPSSKIGIHADETTLGEMFESKGYRTAAIGKWHLGHHAQFLPTKHGFQSWLGLPYSNDMWPHHPTAKVGTYPPLPLYDGDKVIDADVDAKDQETLTARYTDRAVKIINESSEKPFFIYLAYSMPHVPLFTTAEFRGKGGTPYGDVVQELDFRVGQILDALKTRKLDGDTIVIFTSDNGPWLTYGDHAGSTGGLRGAKGTVWEGGVRVPCVMHWPGRIHANSYTREPVMTIDIFPTLAKFIGAEPPKRKIDGLDLSEILCGKPNAPSPHKSLAFYYRDNQLQAVRMGDHKLVLPHSYPYAMSSPGNGKPGRAETRVISKPELYPVHVDPGEQENEAARPESKEILKALLAEAEKYRADLGDSLTKQAGANRREPGRMP